MGMLTNIAMSAQWLPAREFAATSISGIAMPPVQSERHSRGVIGTEEWYAEQMPDRRASFLKRIKSTYNSAQRV
jgi:hypothetical protein